MPVSATSGYGGAAGRSRTPISINQMMSFAHPRFANSAMTPQDAIGKGYRPTPWAPSSMYGHGGGYGRGGFGGGGWGGARPRIGSAAGAVNSQGTPTSQRGRFERAMNNGASEEEAGIFAELPTEMASDLLGQAGSGLSYLGWNGGRGQPWRKGGAPSNPRGLMKKLIAEFRGGTPPAVAPVTTVTPTNTNPNGFYPTKTVEKEEMMINSPESVTYTPPAEEKPSPVVQSFFNNPSAIIRPPAGPPVVAQQSTPIPTPSAIIRPPAMPLVGPPKPFDLIYKDMDKVDAQLSEMKTKGDNAIKEIDNYLNKGQPNLKAMKELNEIMMNPKGSAVGLLTGGRVSGSEKAFTQEQLDRMDELQREIDPSFKGKLGRSSPQEVLAENDRLKRAKASFIPPRKGKTASDMLANQQAYKDWINSYQ